MQDRPARMSPRPTLIHRFRSLFSIGLMLWMIAGPRAAWADAGPEAGQRPGDVLAQVDSDVPDQDTGETPTPDPDDAEWDEENDRPIPQTQTKPEDLPQQPAPADSASQKGFEPAPTDSVLKAKLNSGATSEPLDSSLAKPSAVAKKPLGAASAERKPYFGLHPAVFFVGLLVGHIFVVRAVTD